MPRTRLHSIALLVLAAALLVPAASASAFTRYAAGNGTGDAPCTKAATPCSLPAALGAAVAGDDIQLAAGPGVGNYYKAGAVPYDTTVTVPSGITLHGASTSTLPVIYVAPPAGKAGVLVQGAIRDVAIESTASDASFRAALTVDQGTTAERVRVHAAASANSASIQDACAVHAGAKLLDSVCLGTSSPAQGSVIAVEAFGESPATTTLRNVTAISTSKGSSSYGIAAQANAVAIDSIIQLHVTNTIARGTSSDLVAVASTLDPVGGMAPIASAQVTIDHSNWKTERVDAGDGTAAGIYTSGGGNQSGASAPEPLFANAATGDFHELDGSPTIDTGADDPASGTLALDGAARTIGLRTDMGAYESAYVAPPAPTPTPAPTATPAPTPSPGPGGSDLSTFTRDLIPPKLSALLIGSSLKRSKSSAIYFTLSEPATVTLAFGQPTTGRTVSGTCVKATTKNRTKKHCTLANVKGTLTVNGTAGANSVSFKGGKTSARKALALGKYTLTATAVDPAGNRGVPASRTFRLR